MTTTPPPTIGGYTPETLMTEVVNRGMAQIQLEVRSKGGKLTASTRDTLRTGLTIGATTMFKIIGEIAAEQAKS